MIERVAKAICESHGYSMDDVGAGNPCGVFTTENYREFARAAIKAMKEPTEAMMDAAILYLPAVLIEDGFSPDVLYGVMIDAAAKE